MVSSGRQTERSVLLRAQLRRPPAGIELILRSRMQDLTRHVPLLLSPVRLGKTTLPAGIRRSLVGDLVSLEQAFVVV